MARQQTCRKRGVGARLARLARQVRRHREVLGKVRGPRPAVECLRDDVVGKALLADEAASIPRVDDGDGDLDRDAELSMAERSA